MCQTSLNRNINNAQAAELVAARAEAQQLSNAQAALQGAFVQLQTEADCLRMRPTPRQADGQRTTAILHSTLSFVAVGAILTLATKKAAALMHEVVPDA